MDGLLSQDEINALLNGMSTDETEEQAVSEANNTSEELTPMEIDVIGEVANISMGSSATTLYSLVNTKVNITTPVVTLANWDTMIKDYERPCVFIQIQYTKGLDGSNVLVLKENDVKIITDLMMGGDGSNVDGELGELHLSAIAEAMNQMMGSAATSLSSMLNKMIDISPPTSSLVDLAMFESGADVSPFLGGTFVKIAFNMQIGDLVDSTIMQLYPIDFAKDLVEIFCGSKESEAQPEPPSTPSTPEPQAYNPPPVDNGAQPQMGMPQQQMDMQAGMMQGMPPQMGYGMPPQMGYGMPPQMGYGMQPQVNVQPAQFQNFTPGQQMVQSPENIELIMDVPLEVTVELGRSNKSIAEVLEFAPGTIIELNRIAGEPIDVLVNGKYVAKGEVVVIEESFGIRVTEIIK